MKLPTDIETVNRFLADTFGGHHHGQSVVTRFEPSLVVCEHAVKDNMIRPGGLISGPTQMTLADLAAYVVIFTRLGITPMAVTSNLSMDFLRPCRGERLVAEGRMVKLGRTLAVVNVEIRGGDAPNPSSQAVVTYALPRPS